MASEHLWSWLNWFRWWRQTNRLRHARPRIRNEYATGTHTCFPSYCSKRVLVLRITTHEKNVDCHYAEIFPQSPNRLLQLAVSPILFPLRWAKVKAATLPKSWKTYWLLEYHFYRHRCTKKLCWRKNNKIVLLQNWASMYKIWRRCWNLIQRAYPSS